VSNNFEVGELSLCYNLVKFSQFGTGLVQYSYFLAELSVKDSSCYLDNQVVVDEVAVLQGLVKVSGWRRLHVNDVRLYFRAG
jgi:hypothetical protein